MTRLMLTKATNKYLSMAYYAWKNIQEYEVLMFSKMELSILKMLALSKQRN